MKNRLSLLLLCLILGLMMNGCFFDMTSKEPVQDTGEVNTQVNQTVEESNDEPVTIVENYLPEKVFNEMKILFETGSGKFSCFSAGGAPYAIRDLYTISDCIVKSISIPVYRTTTTDEKGNFYFTVCEVGNTYDGLKQRIHRTHKIEINAEEYGLPENANVFRFITVDVSEYQIELEDSETLALFDATDTVFPAYINDITETNPAAVLMRRDFGVTGFISHISTASMKANLGIFLFDFKLERSYDNKVSYEAELQAEVDYQAKLAAVKEHYSGKCLSVIGDSISTWTGISNSTLINSTLGKNAIYNTTARNFNGYTDIYWGRLMTDLDMELCVNNAWSGSRVYGGRDSALADNMLLRSSQLARDNGMTPDFILVYMGINDILKDTPEGDLYSILTNGDNSKTQREKVEEWFAKIYAKAESTDGIIPGTTYAGWEEAYALSIQNMLTTYPAAEIYCLTLLKSYDSACTDEALKRSNTCIRAIADYFDIGVVDQNASILNERTFSNGCDETGLHPSIVGHREMAKLIVETLYEDLE